MPDFGNVKFLLSTKSMSELETRIYIASNKIIMKKKSFIFKLTYFLKFKPNESKTIQIKSALPKALRNGDFIAKTFRRFLNYFANSFMCMFTKGVSYITVTNPTKKSLSLKGGTGIGSITFETVQNLNAEKNNISHYHVDLDGGIAFCGYSKDVCPIVNCKTQQGTTRESSQASSSMYNTNQYRRKCNDGNVTDKEVLTHDLVMSDYYAHDQDKMTSQMYA